VSCERRVNGKYRARGGNDGMKYQFQALFYMYVSKNISESWVIVLSEFAMPDQDIALGFYQIAKYNYYPGWAPAGIGRRAADE
jgi:hypothetical protein